MLEEAVTDTLLNVSKRYVTIHRVYLLAILLLLSAFYPMNLVHYVFRNAEPILHAERRMGLKGWRDIQKTAKIRFVTFVFLSNLEKIKKPRDYLDFCYIWIKLNLPYGTAYRINNSLFCTTVHKIRTLEHWDMTDQIPINGEQ